ncbi:hypothetical protein QZH41_016274, partial [Actinostola sp. cb2023]
FDFWKQTTNAAEMNNNDDADDLSLAEKAAASERFYNDLDPLKEDLSEWLCRVLQVDITPDRLLDCLDNGLLVCKLAEIVQKAGEDYNKSGKTGPSFPPFTVKYHKNAKSQTFLARDNTANFLQWCKEMGVQESVMFESDGLVLHKQPREVVLCLLDVARIAAKVGIEPPNLIKLENEIDKEIADDGKKELVKPKKKTSKALKIDSEVARLAAKYNVRIERIKEGRYIVEGKINIFVRILRNHVMVRVGGGWDTLEHFISRHDPKKVGKLLMCKYTLKTKHNRTLYTCMKWKWKLASTLLHQVYVLIITMVISTEKVYAQPRPRYSYMDTYSYTGRKYH